MNKQKIKLTIEFMYLLPTVPYGYAGGCMERDIYVLYIIRKVFFIALLLLFCIKINAEMAQTSQVKI